MNNDTHTEQRRQWVNDQQEMSIEPLAYEDLTLDQQCILIDKLDKLNEDLIDDDHTEALKTNQLFDTLQAILDQAEEPRADLRAEYEDQANADRQMFDDDHTEALKTDKFLDMLDEYMESNH